MIKKLTFIVLLLILYPVIYSYAQSSQPIIPGQQTVYISIYLIDIQNINTKNQTFDAEFYLWLKWKEGRSGKNIEYMNAIDTRNIFYDEWADDMQRVSAKVRGTFKSHFDVEKYPFDKQTLKIRISDYDWNFDSLIYEVEQSKIGISNEIFNDEWDIKLKEAKQSKEYISEDNFSVFELTLDIERKSFSVFIKIILPLFIIMLIAFLNLFIPRDQIESGIGLGISSLLSIIALHFSIAAQLPDVNYATKVDILFIASFFFNLLLVVWVVIGYNLWVSKKQTAINKVNIYLKPAIPLLYFVFALVVLKVI